MRLELHKPAGNQTGFKTLYMISIIDIYVLRWLTDERLVVGFVNWLSYDVISVCTLRHHPYSRDITWACRISATSFSFVSNILFTLVYWQTTSPFNSKGIVAAWRCSISIDCFYAKHKGEWQTGNWIIFSIKWSVHATIISTHVTSHG